MATGPGDPGPTAPPHFAYPDLPSRPTPASHAGLPSCVLGTTGRLAVPSNRSSLRPPLTNGLGRPDGAGPSPTDRVRPPAMNAPQSYANPLMATSSVSGPPSVVSLNAAVANSGAEMDTSEALADDGFTLVDHSRRRKRRKENDGYDSDSSNASNSSTVCSRERIAPLPKREKIPPIVVQGMQKWNALLRTLKAQGLNFEAKFVGPLLHIMCQTADDFRSVQRYLTATHLTFHTFCLREERELKVTVRGLPHDTPQEEIKEELEGEGFTPTNIVPLQRRDGRTRAPSNTFLLKLKKSGSWARIWDLKQLLGVRVTVGEFRPRRGLPQCFNCQRYGHSSFYCHLPPRCVKCGGPHSGRDCTTPLEDIPVCVNCSGKHPASYRGCPSHKDAMAARRRRNQPPTRSASQHRPRQPSVPRPPTTAGGNTRPAATSQVATPPVQPRPEPVQETEAPTPRPSKPTLSYAAATRRAPRPRRPRRNTNYQSFVSETETDAETAPAAPIISAPEPKFPKPRQRAPKSATVTCDKPVTQTATPSQNTVSTAALVQWIATLIPLILGSAHMQPAELLVSVLSSLQTLIAANGQAA